MIKLQPEDQAPVFDLKDIFGNRIDLQTYRDRKLLIGFFRHAGCPFCNLRIHRLLQVHNELGPKGLQMIFFFESPEKILSQSQFHQGVPYIPLISDPKRKWYGRYGLEQSFLKSTLSHLTSFLQTAYQSRHAGLPVHAMKAGESIATMPAEFLISEGLIIKDAYYSAHLKDRLDVGKIRTLVDSATVAVSKTVETN